MGIALIARVVAASVIGGEFYFADEALYVDTARRLSAGQGFDPGYAGVPGYPAFLVPLLLWSTADLTILRISQAVITAIGSMLVFRLADRMIGRHSAIAADAVYALDPLLVIGAGLLYPEAVAALLLPLIVLAALNACDRGQLGWSAISGVLLGLLALLRPVALILPPVVGVWIGLTVQGRLGRRLAHFGALALAVLLVLAPWTAWNWKVHHGLVPVSSVGGRMLESRGQNSGSDGLLAGLTREFASDPAAFLSRTVSNFVQFWELTPTRLTTDDPEKRLQLRKLDPRLPAEPLFPHDLRDIASAVSFTLELCLALIGLVVIPRTRWRSAILPMAMIASYAAGYALLVVKLRYRMPVLPLLFLFTGAGGEAVYGWMTRRSGRPAATG